MAKTRIFISSTYVDLKDTREQLKNYFEENHMEPILFERGSISFDWYKNVDVACYNEVEKATIFTLIIGGRYGSPPSEGVVDKKSRQKQIIKYNSITKKEYLRAKSKNIPIFIFIDKNVYSEYKLFTNNRKNRNIKYKSIDNINIFYLIDEILSEKKNNFVREFEYTNEIIDWLKIQLSGLLKSLIEEQRQFLEKIPQSYYVNPFKLFYKRRTNKDVKLTTISKETGIPYKTLCNLERFNLQNTEFDFKEFKVINKEDLKKLCSFLNCSFKDITSDIKSEDDFASNLIEYYHNYKRKNVRNRPSNRPESLETKVVVLDFDGTLTESKKNETTWELIWSHLGYSSDDCGKYHKQFIRNEISHSKWCQITLQKFKEKSLHKDQLIEVSDKISLIPGLNELVETLSAKNIKLYILSGSIEELIKLKIGNLTSYFRGISANNLYFDRSGFLADIIGTNYDFKGKATYIKDIIRKENISPYEVLFVGNSINDIWAYESGARTLCVNPSYVNAYDNVRWLDFIPKLNNMTEILKFV